MTMGDDYYLRAPIKEWPLYAKALYGLIWILFPAIVAVGSLFLWAGAACQRLYRKVCPPSYETRMREAEKDYQDRRNLHWADRG